MRLIIFIFSCFLFIQCSVDRTMLPLTKSENIRLEAFQKLDTVNKLFITDDDEPGERLTLCLTFIDEASKKVLSNQQVSFYHTSSNGKYEPTNPNDETTARLNGTAMTNADGKIYVRTILPGDYGSADHRHIHTTVYGAHPEPNDIFFNQYSGRIGKFMNLGNDQMFYAELKKTADDLLVCLVIIEAKNPKVID